ncbi:protein moonraker isoform X1 [Petromyzon marinus]|uniref:protein moonraker isoform X1 n=1 Tax=Petromyzon marinus TaxID=7757 RepID=UPI003F713E33
MEPKVRPSGRAIQLRFNLDPGMTARSLVTHFSNPRPIVIEKLGTSCGIEPPSTGDGDDSALSQSGRFSVLSADRLSLAVQLARRDLKRRRAAQKMQGMTSGDLSLGSPIAGEEAAVSHAPGGNAGREQRRSQLPAGTVTASGAVVYVYPPGRKAQPAPGVRGGREPRCSNSPPTRDPGPTPPSQHGKGAAEIRRLRKELGHYISRVEELASQGKGVEEHLEVEEKRRAHTRRQEQAARTARVLYMLQQQIREIEEELDKMGPNKSKHTNKSRAEARLAAAHRGAVRALQMLASQLSQPASRVPPHAEELSRLVRQLSLCSARLGGGDDVAHILQQLEGLKRLLKEQKSPARQRESSPVRHGEGSPVRHGEGSRIRRGEGSPVRRGEGNRGGRRVSPGKRSWSPPMRHSYPVARQLQFKDRGEVRAGRARASSGGRVDEEERRRMLRSGLQALVHKARGGRSGVLLPGKTQGASRARGRVAVRGTRFQRATLASHLKRSQPGPRDPNLPWLPPNPTSPSSSPKHRSPVRGGSTERRPAMWRSPERECSTLLRDVVEQERLEAARKEAIRLAWLDSETARRMRELNDLCQQEIDHIHQTRQEAGSPSQWVTKAEQAVREKLQPLLKQAQEISDSLEKKFYDQEEGRVDGRGRRLPHGPDALPAESPRRGAVDEARGVHEAAVAMQDAPSVETILQRLQDMEKEQDTIRRKWTCITYSGPEFWAQEEWKAEQEHPSRDCRPATPRALCISRPSGHEHAEVVVQPPASPTHSDSSEERDGVDHTALAERGEVRPLRGTGGGGAGVPLAVPASALLRLRDYGEHFSHHLRMTGHEAVGSFSPWGTASELADALLEEALCEVSEELLGICEGYAEAVYDSEFLQPGDAASAQPCIA